MAYTIDEKDALSRSVTIELTNDEIQKLVNQKLRQLQKTVKIHGFRKGKVPMSVLKQRYGGGSYQEAIEELLNKSMEKVSRELPAAVYFGEHALRPGEDGGITSTVYVEVMPELDPVGYLGLEVQAPKFEVTDEILMENLKGIQKQHAILEPVEDRDVIEVGDVVRIDLRPIAKTVDELEDSMLTATDVTLFIPEEEEKRSPLADSLIGASKSELLTVVQKLADLGINSYGPEESCTLEVTVHAINKQVLPELNDDLALESQLADTYDELVELLKERILAAMNKTRLAVLRSEVAKRLIEKFPFDLPPQFLNREIDAAMRQYLHTLGVRGALSPQFNLALAVGDIDVARDGMREEVERNIRVRHLASLIEKSDDAIGDLTNEEFQTFIREVAERSQIPFSSMMERLREDQNEVNALAQEARLERVLNYIAENAEVTDITPEEFEKLSAEEEEKQRKANENRLVKVLGLKMSDPGMKEAFEAQQKESSEEESASTEEAPAESKEEKTTEE